VLVVEELILQVDDYQPNRLQFDTSRIEHLPPPNIPPAVKLQRTGRWTSRASRIKHHDWIRVQFFHLLYLRLRLGRPRRLPASARRGVETGRRGGFSPL
jgi:hypothetical protein